MVEGMLLTAVIAEVGTAYRTVVSTADLFGIEGRLTSRYLNIIASYSVARVLGVYLPILF